MENMKKTNFCDLGLSPWIIRQCHTIGIKHPTAIQENCIPKIIAGSDCMGCAKTGSGKTLAFVLPIIHKLFEDPYGIFAVIITPTRELAFQIGDQFEVIGKTVNIRCCIITGGMEMIVQAQELSKKPHVVVTTPGRFADHLESCNTFSLHRIKFVVLDEADTLLGGRYDSQMRTIFKALPKNKQMLLFSATMTDTLHKVDIVASHKFFKYECKTEVATVDELDQYYVLCPLDAKDGYLVETVRTFQATNKNYSIIIFTETCKNCQILSVTLNEAGFVNVALHSVMSQKQRLASLAKFKSHVITILLATDVASRGLDIPAVSLVINHTIPKNPVDYIHRVGRTARAGHRGLAISLVTQYDITLIKAIEKRINYKLKEYNVKNEEVAKILTQVKVTMREASIKLDETDFNERKLINKRKKLIVEGKDPDEIENKLKRIKKLKTKGKTTYLNKN